MILTIQVLLCSILSSIFSTAILSYIAMATPIGPWIELVLVLLATMIFRVFLRYTSSEKLKYALVLTTVSGGVGGIVATVCGFYVPTLYFLNQEIFNEWLATPVLFCAYIAGLIAVAGGVAFILVYLFQDTLLADKNMSFPIGQMVARFISAQNQLRKSIELFTGVTLTSILGLIQRFTGWIPDSVTLVPRFSVWVFSFPSLAIRFDLMPIFLAIGYVAGYLLALPLLVGVFTKLFIVVPVRALFFPALSISNFILAFGCGILLHGVLVSFFQLPHVFVSSLAKFRQFGARAYPFCIKMRSVILWSIIGLFIALASMYWLFFDFSWYSQLYLYLFTVVCMCQLLVIGGKIGLAPIGRFATFVMMPGIIIFGFNDMQIMLVSVFVGLAGGIAVDLMFGRKLAQLTGIARHSVARYQLLGLVVSALTVGVIQWLLIHHFGLGSAELVAQRAQARALLVTVFNFNYTVLLFGVLFGAFLRWIKISGMLVFTGLLFPVQFSLMLIAGGLLTKVAQDKEEWDPFWSGVFAAGSLWMVLKAFL